MVAHTGGAKGGEILVEGVANNGTSPRKRNRRLIHKKVRLASERNGLANCNEGAPPSVGVEEIVGG